MTPWWRGRPTMELCNSCEYSVRDGNTKRETYGKTARGASSPKKRSQLCILTTPRIVLNHQQLRKSLSDGVEDQIEDNLQPALHIPEPLSIT
jgi:hypothetical protein